jgi:hypothetical protein
MPAVNALALAGLAGLGACLALRHGWSAWWGLSLPIVVNAGLSLLQNLTDLLSALAVVGLLAGWLAGARPWALLGWALAALLCREQNVVVVGVIGLAGLWRGNGRVVVSLAAAGVLWAGWVAALWVAYGTPPFSPAHGNFGAPLAGMLYRWRHLGGHAGFSPRQCLLYTCSMLHLSFLLGLAAYLAARPGSRVVRLTLLAGVAFALVGGTLIYCDFRAYTRVFIWVPLGIWLLGLGSGSRWLVSTLLPAGLWPVAVVLR